MDSILSKLAIYVNLFASFAIVSATWFATEPFECRSFYAQLAIFHMLSAGVFGIIELIRLKEATR